GAADRVREPGKSVARAGDGTEEGIGDPVGAGSKLDKANAASAGGESAARAGGRRAGRGGGDRRAAPAGGHRAGGSAAPGRSAPGRARALVRVCCLRAKRAPFRADSGVADEPHGAAGGAAIELRPIRDRGLSRTALARAAGGARSRLERDAADYGGIADPQL